jgi:sugar lactone lactonase YvrE
VEGLHAPKGLAVVGDILYIDELIEININNGPLVKCHPAFRANFLDDVAADQQGNIYVSDMLTNTLHHLSEGQFSIWQQNDALVFPNGLYVEGDHLIVGSWCVTTAGFKSDVPGHLKQVSLVDRSIARVGNGSPVGNLDGGESDGNANYFVTDWLSGGLFKIYHQGNTEKLLPLVHGSADLGMVLNQQLLLVPMMLENRFVAFKIQ